MPQFCCVPGCSNQSDRETHLSFHRLPLKRKPVLKSWIHKIGRENILLTEKTRICSEHFVNSKGRMLRRDEVPSLKLPSLPTAVAVPVPQYSLNHEEESSEECSIVDKFRDIGINTDLTMHDIEAGEMKVDEINKLEKTEAKLDK